MKLELKHLAPYLPYGLKFIHDEEPTPYLLMKLGLKTDQNPLWIEGYNGEFEISVFPEGCKPILRPLSDLTKEIEHNGEKFEDAGFFRMFYNGLSDNEIHLDGVTFKLEVWQELFKWHFDVFGLIEAGLAIDMNTLKETT